MILCARARGIIAYQVTVTAAWSILSTDTRWKNTSDKLTAHVPLQNPLGTPPHHGDRFAFHNLPVLPVGASHYPMTWLASAMRASIGRSASNPRLRASWCDLFIQAYAGN